jgi:HEPN domain-containing protein
MLMNSDKINIEKIINHWVLSSDNDFKTMCHLYETKDFHWSLFMGHIVIERLLKAVVVQRTKNHAPFTHDLRRLAKLSQLDFKEEHLDWLDTITTFNINARYDSYKQAFYKKCNSTFTAEWIRNIKELRKWIKTKL